MQTVRLYGKAGVAGVSNGMPIRLRNGLRLQAQTRPARATPSESFCWMLLSPGSEEPCRSTAVEHNTGIANSGLNARPSVDEMTFAYVSAE
jgi:hypothetical protein